MQGDLTLEPQLEAFLKSQVVCGRYESAAAVIARGLRLLQRAQLDEGIRQGLADAKAGRVYDLDEVFDALEAQLEVRVQQHTG